MGAVPAAFLEKWQAVGTRLGTLNPWALAVAVLALGIIVGWPYVQPAHPESVRRPDRHHGAGPSAARPGGDDRRPLRRDQRRPSQACAPRCAAGPASPAYFGAAFTIALLGAIESAAVGGGVGWDDRRPSSLEHGARGAGGGEHRLTDLRRHPRDRGDRAHGHECEERWPHTGGGDRARLHPAPHHGVLRPLGGPHSHGDAGRDPRGRGLPHERVAHLPVRAPSTQERRRRAARDFPPHRARGLNGRDRGRDWCSRRSCSCAAWPR